MIIMVAVFNFFPHGRREEVHGTGYTDMEAIAFVPRRVHVSEIPRSQIHVELSYLFCIKVTFQQVLCSSFLCFRKQNVFVCHNGVRFMVPTDNGSWFRRHS
jgi:hypothetical protein